MNHIEDGIEAATNAINDSVTNITAGLYMTVEKNGQTYLVKVNDTALALDYIKLDKTKSGVIPQIKNGVVAWLPSSTSATANSIPQRNDQGDCNFNKLNFEFIGYKDDTSPSVMYYYDIYNNTKNSDYLIEKTATNTGKLTTTQLTELQNQNQSKNLRIVYDNEVYYRITKQGLPNLQYIHLDSVSGKATGKIFNILRTGEWQIFNLNFGGNNRTTHNLTLTDSSAESSIYFSLTNNRPETYEGAPADLWSALKNSHIACTIYKNGTYYSGIITTLNNYFRVLYGSNNTEVQYAQSSISITDNMA